MERLYVLSGRLVSNTDTTYIRYLHKQIKWSEHLICIKGPRGVGKSTMLKQHIKLNNLSPQQALYLSLDHTWFATHSLLEVAEYHYTHGGTHMFLDEVHRYKNWQQEIKNIVDFYPSMYVVFTGSAMLKLDNAVADLSRRCVDYTMQGLSFREYLMFENIAEFEPIGLDDLLQSHLQISLDINRNMHVLPYFDTYLHTGYYPFYKQEPATYFAKLQHTISTVIDVDIPQSENIEYETLYKTKKLLAILAELVPYTLNVSDLCKNLGVNRSQVLRLLNLLERSALIRKLYADENGIQTLAKPEKVLFDNTNVMYALTDKVDVGTIRETFFCNQLSTLGSLIMPRKGDVMYKGLTFEIGGKSKTNRQINSVRDSYIIADNIESGFGNKIPLWMFGMMY